VPPTESESSAIVSILEDRNEARAQRAVARLSVPQRQLVGACLEAIAHGAYLPEWEFQTVMGNFRDEVCAVASAWPAVNGDTFLAVNNTLNNLLGYPHGRWSELTEVLGVDEQAVAEVLKIWRAENPPTGDSGSSHFEFLL
jgi:hypothetical protein